MKRAVSDRSRTLVYQRCPRLRWLTYELKGRGVSRHESPLPLMVGKAIHAGLENLLLQHGEEVAVEKALAEVETSVELGPFEDSYYVNQEQRALVEALIRGYSRSRLEHLLSIYEVLGVERELVWEDFSSSVTWMARTDGDLRERNTGDVHVLSFKSAKEYGRRTEEENKIDMQGVSEMAALQALEPSWNILAVKMDYLIKGKREEWPKGSGIMLQQSSLIRPWTKGVETALDWEWTDEQGKSRRLGTGWSRQPIWTKMEMAEWILQLSYSPDTIGKFFVSPEPYYRRPSDIKEWHRATAFQEGKVAQDSAYINSLPDGDLKERELDKFFPKHRRSCLWPTPCSFIGVCHKGESVEEGLENGSLKWREANHELEKERYETTE